MKTHDEAEAFARRWVETWNRLDVEGMLSHFDEAVRFTSPRAAQRMGVATVEDKDALRTYWQTSVAQITSLRFTLDHVVWDAESGELAIVYDAEINGHKQRASELLRFGPDDQVVYGEALYGAQL